MRISVIGLGQMGLPIATVLAAQGMGVCGYDRDPARMALAAARGVTPAGSIAAATAADLVLTLLPDDAALTDLCMAPDGLLANLRPGGVHLCLGTLGVATAQALDATHAAAGQAFVACPVFGRPEEAGEGDLTAVFGSSAAAPAEAVALARSVVARLAPRLHEVPSPSAACAVKLAGNQMIATAIAAMDEGFGLAQAHGVPPPLVHAILTGKLFRGPVYEGVGRIVAGAGPAPAVPAFTLRLGLKDLKLCAEAALAADYPMPVADAVRTRLAGAVAAGRGARDWAEPVEAR